MPLLQNGVTSMKNSSVGVPKRLKVKLQYDLAVPILSVSIYPAECESRLEEAPAPHIRSYLKLQCCVDELTQICGNGAL